MDKEIKKHVFEAVKNEKTRLPSEIVNKQIEAFSSVENTKHTGTGLINVFLRLKLYFHRDDIFDITKGENGEGTKFIIKVPKNV
jgi:sensor histidine kinase YesM